MITLPRLQNLVATAHELHRAAELLGAVQRLTQPPLPAYLELGLLVGQDGLSTGRLLEGGRVQLQLTTGEVVYTPANGPAARFPINGSTQARLFADLFGALAQGELTPALPAGGDLFQRVSQGIASHGGRYRPPARERLLDETPIRVDADTAHGYNQLLQIIYNGVARFSARCSELKTPLVVWPEHFDLSTLLFVGNEVDESQPHLNFGFAPYSAGMDFPYLYVYAYPTPAGYTPACLPGGVHWTTEGWTGAWMNYSSIASQEDGAVFVDETCSAIYACLRPVLGA